MALFLLLFLLCFVPHLLFPGLDCQKCSLLDSRGSAEAEAAGQCVHIDGAGLEDELEQVGSEVVEVGSIGVEGCSVHIVALVYQFPQFLVDADEIVPGDLALDEVHLALEQFLVHHVDVLPIIAHEHNRGLRTLLGVLEQLREGLEVVRDVHDHAYPATGQLGFFGHLGEGVTQDVAVLEVGDRKFVEVLLPLRGEQAQDGLPAMMGHEEQSLAQPIVVAQNKLDLLHYGCSSCYLLIRSVWLLKRIIYKANKIVSKLVNCKANIVRK